MTILRPQLFRQLLLSGVGAAFGKNIDRRIRKAVRLFERVYGYPVVAREPITAVELLTQLSKVQLRDAEYVPEPVSSRPPTDLRCIAFYLPQFHPIPENDRWWGKGFTEWMSVSRAASEFSGHQQPQRPGELGYYDLRSRRVQRRQSELAGLHGLHGFCYYFYWFNGRTLLEEPLRMKLADTENSFPFCICWANENWTRRWDGLDQHVLIEQRHSPDDDLAFIAHVAPYLRDARYIRVDGKPLLLVYRPGLLPEAAATAVRWRQYCRDNDLGEIFLVNVQSLDRMDPASMGFDAAVDFAPTSRAAANITATTRPYRSDFAGGILDYRTLVADSYALQQDGRAVFQSVCSGWDNTPRRQENATIYRHSSPAAYQEWLENVCRYTRRAFQSDKQLVFINAWNEWGEGAMLEPSWHLGYGNLNATAKALMNVGLAQGQRPATAHVAVIVHAYYADLWPEIAGHLRQWTVPFRLYVSTCEDAVASLRQQIVAEWPNAMVESAINRGRDIAPFLRFLPIALRDGAELVCKIHTKKSPQRKNGETWRRDLYAKLLGGTHDVEQIIKAFSGDTGLGVLAPEGHIAHIRVHWTPNREKATQLAERMGHLGELLPRAFVAGSMFWARISALQPILQLQLKTEDFEPESGQIDGTLAHALERLFAVSAKLSGFRLADTRIVGYAYSPGGPLRSDLQMDALRPSVLYQYS